MLKFNSMRLLIFIFLTGVSIQAGANPTVLVSVPALHSLVSGLMDGVAEPQLIMDDDESRHDTTLSARQLHMLANADMIIWAGPGLEKGLQDAVDNKVPTVRNKLLPLSAFVPLLKSDQTGDTDPANYRKVSRNLEFWNDPRLSIIAIRTLTPRLVRLDPDNTERYLDNEIALIKRLKGVEQEMANTSALIPVDFTGLTTGSNSYFKYRMHNPVLAAKDLPLSKRVATADCHDNSFKKVAVDSSRPSANIQSFYGTDFYFHMMHKEIEKFRVNNCRASV